MATKIDLINKIHKQLDYLSKEDVSDSVNLILNYLSNSLKEQNNVTLDKQKKESLDYVLKYIEMFDPLKFTKNEQLQPRYNDEDTLEY